MNAGRVLVGLLRVEGSACVGISCKGQGEGKGAAYKSLVEIIASAYKPFHCSTCKPKSLARPRRGLQDFGENVA